MACADVKLKAQLITYARGVSQSFGIPENLIVRMMEKETSCFDSEAVNTATGARGILQQRDIFVDDMALRFKYSVDPLNPYQAIIAAAKYLKFMNAIYTKAMPAHSNHWDLAVMAYNLGHVGVKRFLSGVALYGKAKIPRETFNYVSYVAPEFLRAGAFA